MTVVIIEPKIIDQKKKYPSSQDAGRGTASGQIKKKGVTFLICILQF